MAKCPELPLPLPFPPAPAVELEDVELEPVPSLRDAIFQARQEEKDGFFFNVGIWYTELSHCWGHPHPTLECLA